jgi:class 3 adenylate cyclase/TolB-like protein
MTSLFFSDIVGYSQMVAKDESHALNLLDEHDIILKKHIGDYDGSIIKHIGDAIFAKFNNPQNLIDASLQIQKELKNRNETLPDNDKILIRIGLHNGDVIEKDGDLFGNEVNLCSRIESISIPGGIACSEPFFTEIKDVFSRPYGFVKLKNIPKPQKIYRIYNDELEYNSDSPKALLSLLNSRNINVVETDAIVLDYKTLAFLYPQNLGEKDQDFFCFEILQQLINDSNKVDLIRSPSVNEIAKYNDYRDDLNHISRSLAVEYIAELSVLSVDKNFKLNISVKNMSSDVVIYEKSFDSNISDMRSVSGEILVDLSSEFGIDISDNLRKIFKQKVEIDDKAYKLFLEGKFLSDKMSDSESLNHSKEKLEAAIEIDDEFAQAYAALGLTYSLFGEYEDAEENLEEAIEYAEDLENIEVSAFVFNYTGLFYKKIKKIKKSIKYFEKAIKCQKKIGDKYLLANYYHNMANCYGIDGNADKMLNLIERSQKIYLELDDISRLGNSYAEMGNAFKTMQRFDDSIAMFDKAKPIFLSEEMFFKYSQVLIIQSDVFIDQEDFDRANNNLQKIKKYSELFDNPIMNGRIAFSYARVMYGKGELSDAIDYIDESIEIFQDLDNKAQLASLFIFKANIMIDRKKIKRVEFFLDKAKKYMKRLNDPSLALNLKNVEQRYSEYLKHSS